MPVGDQLALLGEPLEHVALEADVVAVDEVERRGSRTMKPPLIQPSPICDFSVKRDRSPSPKTISPKRDGRTNSRDGRDLAVRAVELEQPAEVDVRDAVAVGEQERLVAEPASQATDAAAGGRVLAGVDEVTVHGSGGRWSGVTLPLASSTVTSPRGARSRGSSA